MPSLRSSSINWSGDPSRPIPPANRAFSTAATMPRRRTEMQRAVIYCRVSTPEQVENLSLPTQEKRCREYCERLGIEVERVFIEEGESAKTDNRQELQNLLAFCRKNRDQIDYLVVYAVNRFARSNHYHFALRAHLSQLGITLRSVTEPMDDSSAGKLMEGVLAAFAQFDNDVRSERTVQGMRAALAKGRWTHRPPFGYKKPPPASGMPSLIEDPDRAPFVRETFDLIAIGDHSIREVLDIVTDRGLRTHRGKPVTAQSFGSMLRNELYAGIINLPVWDIRVVGDFRPLVSAETFEAVQRVLDGKRAAHNPRVRNHPDFPLRRFVQCAECGAPLTASWSKGRTKRYGYYRCPNADCRAVNARKEALERVFVEQLDHLQPRAEYFDLFTEIVTDIWNRRNRERHQLRSKLEANLAEVEAKGNQLVDAFIHEGKIDQSTYERQRHRLEEERALIEKQIGESVTDDVDVTGILDFARHALLNARPLWVELDHVRKRRFQEVLFPDGVRFDGESIGTDSTSSVFSYLSEISRRKEEMVTPTGFEPVLPA
jgi:site-specific DNA recombinase